jgi:hypothetical protein
MNCGPFVEREMKAQETLGQAQYNDLMLGFIPGHESARVAPNARSKEKIGYVCHMQIWMQAKWV